MNNHNKKRNRWSSVICRPSSFICALNLFFIFHLSLFAQSAPRNITMPTIREVASRFQNPPSQYGPTATWGWEGPISKQSIVKDLDQLHSMGFKAVTIEAGYGMKEHYLTPGYFKLIKYAVQQAKRRNMRVWIIDEGKYPTGFAGGLFSKKRPDLRMQVLQVVDHISVEAGKTIERKLSPNIVSAAAVNSKNNESRVVPVQSGNIKWTAPKGQGNWTLLLVGHLFRTSPTRSINNPTGKKDTTNSLMNYLNPAATQQFLDWTHRQYKKYIGDQFGKTVMGFRSDEPAYYMTPWTPKIFAKFKKEKGYDVQPYLASFFEKHPSEKIIKIKADYWDVWSRMYRNNFFKLIGNWQADHHLEYVDHIDHDGPETNKMMLDMARTEGDYFRDMQYLAIPGVDAIWNQVWPGKVADFPKLASSAAHQFGRSRAFSESFAAYKPRPNVKQVRWVLNDEMAHGINLFEIMFYMSLASKHGGPHGFMASKSFPAVMRYANRACYLLSQGRPASNIAVIFPTSSLWLRDTTANASTWHIVEQLMTHQRNFDFVDDQMLPDMLKQNGEVLENKSGQDYKTIIIPTVSVLPQKDIRILKTFAKAGGHVIFMGQKPPMVEDRTFRNADKTSNLKWAIPAPLGKLTAKVMDVLPNPDLKLDKPDTAIEYVHRHLKNGEVYFLFNRSDKKQERTVTLKGSGQAQVWNANTGQIHLAGKAQEGHGLVRMPLKLKPNGSEFIVVGSEP